MKTLRPIRPNKGIERDYKRRLDKLVLEMNKSVTYWIKAGYKREVVPTLAMDAKSPSVQMSRILKKRIKQWTIKFDAMADTIATWFADTEQKYTDTALKKAFKDAGFTISLKMTPPIKTAMQAVVYENVNLIKSIPRKYLEEVEGLVMRSILDGRNLADLTDELDKRYDITRRRALLIARDQNNKATDSFNRLRSEELGIKKAVWCHSHGDKEPRQSHLRADGKVFDLKKGCYIDGEYIHCGEKINCSCYYRPIVEGFE